MPPGSSGGSTLSALGSWVSPVSCGVAVVATLGWLVVVLATPMAFWCAAMTAMACAAGGTGALAAVLVAAVAVRAGWLALDTARGVAVLPRLTLPAEVATAARRSGTTPIRGVDSAERVAFCVGLWRPRIYVSQGIVSELAADELAAVLAHEHAHARRRDPLRGLLARACADVAFFVPLLRWWQHRRGLHAELAADRAAVEHAGAPALAGALLRLAGPCPGPLVAAAAFGPTDAVLDARIAALTAGTTVVPDPRRPLPTWSGVASVAGVVAVGVVTTCLPAAAVVLG